MKLAKVNARRQMPGEKRPIDNFYIIKSVWCSLMIYLCLPGGVVRPPDTLENSRASYMQGRASALGLAWGSPDRRAPGSCRDQQPQEGRSVGGLRPRDCLQQTFLRLSQRERESWLSVVVDSQQYISLLNFLENSSPQFSSSFPLHQARPGRSDRWGNIWDIWENQFK